MPEQIRLKVGGVTPQQMAVYEEFSRNIPGFIPMGGSLSGELPAGTTADSTSNTTHTAASYIVKPLPVNALCRQCTLMILQHNIKISLPWPSNSRRGVVCGQLCS